MLWIGDILDLFETRSAVQKAKILGTGAVVLVVVVLGGFYLVRSAFFGMVDYAGVQSSVISKIRQIETAIELAEAKRSKGKAPTAAAQGRTSFVELVEMYEGADRDKKASTLDREVYTLGIIKAAPWASQPAEGLDRGAVKAWVNIKLKGGTGRGTLNNLLSTCSAVLSYAKDANWIDDDCPNPFRRCRLGKVVHKLRAGHDLEEFCYLMAAARRTLPPESYRLILAGGLIGWRAGDYRALRVSSVDLDYTVKGQAAPRLVVRPADEKKGAVKVAFLTGPLLAEIREIIGSRQVRRLPSAPVFVQAHGRPWPERDTNPINGALRKALKDVPDTQIPAWKKWGDAAYAPFSFHCLRYTARSIMVALDISDHVINAQCGWTSARQTNMAAHYTTVSDGQLLEAARRVSAAFVATTQARAKKRAVS